MSATQWYVARNGHRIGPMSSADLRSMADAGKVYADMVVHKVGGTGWHPVSAVRGLAVQPVAPEPPPPTVYVAPAPAVNVRPMPVAGHVTIEKTGRGIKAGWLVSWAMFLVGGLVVVTGAQAGASATPTEHAGVAVGALLVVTSIVYGLYLRAVTWWRHG